MSKKKKKTTDLHNGEGCRDPTKQYVSRTGSMTAFLEVMVYVNLSPSLKLVVRQCYHSDLRT